MRNCELDLIITSKWVSITMDIKDLEKYKSILREYQHDAVLLCIKYLSSDSTKNALVHLPTGTGKTGVMATLCALSDSNIFVIVPNATLPMQTKNEIKTDFWRSAGIKIVPDIEISIIDSAAQLDKLNSAKKTVFISTIQYIQEHSYKSNSLQRHFIDNINNNIDYIFFDEGHREPAAKWSQIIRELNSKIILFTATPYRNDGSVFKIDKKYIYSQKMRKHIENGDISDLEFLPLKSIDNNRNTLRANADFTNEEILKIVKQNLDSGKIIIRSHSKKVIEEITEYLNLHNVKTLGLHSRIKNGLNFQSNGKNIAAKSEQYDVFVHSEILIEGLNIPSIKTLLLLDTFSNFRSAVQQIGRVLRFTGKNNAKVYLPDVALDEHKEQWEYLLDYTISTDEYIYASGLIKKRFINGANHLISENNIVIPQRATIYFSEDNIFWDDLTKRILSGFENTGNCKILFEKHIKNKILFTLYEETTYSNFLKNIAFENNNLHICIFVEVDSNQSKGRYYFYFDSNNIKTFDSETIDNCFNSGVKNFENVLDTSLEITRAKYEKKHQLYQVELGEEKLLVVKSKKQGRLWNKSYRFVAI